jgi:hypothetical protein
LLQKLGRLFQVPSTLKSHSPGEIPRIKILRAFAPNPRVNEIRLIVLLGLMERQSFLEEVDSLFVVHMAAGKPHSQCHGEGEKHHGFLKAPAPWKRSIELIVGLPMGITTGH